MARVHAFVMGTESDQKTIKMLSENEKNRHLEVRSALLAWYAESRRVLPWRARAGEIADPYFVWLSEIMLQQTTVATVGPYFARFTETWPTVEALARASLDEVLVAWQGLGYYARARNLHKCAKTVVDDYAGKFPDTEAVLRTLPGIGPYTAAAIAAIAFDRACVPIDGNIERVVARLHDVRTPLPVAKVEIKARAAGYEDSVAPGDFAQAMMDLGATVCTPSSPNCLICPLRSFCAGAAAGDPGVMPVKPPKKPKPTRRAVMFWLSDTQGRVLMRRRAERGLLGGMMEFPSTAWVEGEWPAPPEIAAQAPVETAWQAVPGHVTHTFTHFHFHIRLLRGRILKSDGIDGQWIAPDDFAAVALPTVMKKAATWAQSTGPADDEW